jgi:hypothetical protein
LSGISLCFQKDSRRASLAGMTTYVVLLMTALVVVSVCKNIFYRCHDEMLTKKSEIYGYTC